MSISRGGRRDGERRGYRYRPLDAPTDDPDASTTGAASGNDDDGPFAADTGLEDEDEHNSAEDGDEDEDADEPPSEFWAAADLLKGATVEDTELELSYAASVYAGLPAAEFRLWLRLPDGTRRLAQIDEPHAVWLYREAHRSSGRDFEEYPDQRFELLCTDIRASRARRQRQLIDRQLALHDELVAVGEELEELERNMRDDDTATADWPGARWP